MVVKSDRARESGVTMVELLLVISMSTLIVGMALALFKDVGVAARLSQGRRDDAFRAQAFYSALSGNLMAGGGILRLGPGRLDLLNIRNRRVEYRWEDSALSVNGKNLDFKVAAFQVEPAGPERPVEDGDYPGDGAWALDSLDGDRDGQLGFPELDRDRDGELDPEECRYLARIRVTLTIVHHGLPYSWTCIVHPRNRAQASDSVGTEDQFPLEGIPEP